MKSINMTERTQSVSSVPKIPMDFNEFKSRYDELLDYHLNENIYHDELSFVKKWFNTYSNGSNLLQKTSKPEPLTLIEKRGLKSLGTKNHYYDLELSFSLICKFLRQRKKEIKNIPQQPKAVKTDEVKNKPDSKIHFTIMNEAILSIQASLVEDKKTVATTIKQEQTYVPKPCFKSESIDGIITVLNPYFDKSEHAELRQIIETGNNANDKLLFKDSGNKLTDYFKQLIENNIIIGCNKKVLIDWIVENFKNINGEYKVKTVERTISGTVQPCKNPIT